MERVSDLLFTFYIDIKYLFYRRNKNFCDRFLSKWYTEVSKHAHLDKLIEKSEPDRQTGPIQVFIYLKPDKTFNLMIFDKRFKKIYYDNLFYIFKHCLVPTICSEYTENSVAYLMCLFEDEIFAKMKLEVEPIVMAEQLDEIQIKCLYTMLLFRDIKAEA